MNEKAQEEKLIKPRITIDMIDVEIKNIQYHLFDGTCATVCCLTLQNGFTVVGQSSCTHHEDFDVHIGKRIALEDARTKVWPLMGYRFRDQLTVQK